VTINLHPDGSWTVDGQPVKVSLSFKKSDGEELTFPLRSLQDFAADSETARAATPGEEAQRCVEALNSQPRRSCVKGCGRPREPWRTEGGQAIGSAFCAECRPKIDV
jgi:hypothetical protein